MNNTRKIFVVALIYLAFSALYSFLLVDDSFYNLEGDICNIGSWAYKDVYPEIFNNDPVLKNDNTFYISTHMFMIKNLLRLTNSYIFALKILLFIQVFLTLCSVTFMFSVLFPGIAFFRATLYSFLMTMVFIKVPQIDELGFLGLRTATARSTFGIFIPLLTVFFLKLFDNWPHWNRFKFALFALSAGLLANFHPHIGIMFFSTTLICWFLLRIGKFKKEFPGLLLGILFFLLSILPFCNSFIKETYGKNIFSFILKVPERIEKFHEISSYKKQRISTTETQRKNSEPEPAVQEDGKTMSRKSKTPEKTSGIKKTGKKNFNYSRWIFIATFLPYFIPFVLLIYFRKHLQIFSKINPLILPFSLLFMTAYILNTLGTIMCEYGIMNILLIPYFRGGKITFFFLELIMFYFFTYGRKSGLSPRIFYTLSAAVIFALFMMSLTRLELSSASAAWIGWISGVEGRLVNTLILRFVSIAVLFIIICLPLLRILEKSKAVKVLIFYCIFLLVVWPLLCSGPRIKAGELMDSTNGIGSWTLAGKFTDSRCAFDIQQFDELVNWIDKNAAENSMLLYLMGDTYGHKLKIATRRAGFGDMLEHNFIAAPEDVLKSVRFFTKHPQPKSYVILMDTARKYGVDFVIVDKNNCTELLEFFTNYTKMFENGNYVVFKFDGD